MARFIKSRHKSKGKVPGSVVFIGNKKIDKARISVIRYNQSVYDEFQVKDISEVSDHLRTEYITWINIDGLHDTNLIENLGEQFHISSLVLEDVVNTDQRPALNISEENITVILKSFLFKNDDPKLHTEQISFILLDKCLITLQERIGDFFEPVRERIRKNWGRIRNSGSDYLFYALLDALFDSYYENLEKLGNKVEALDEKILKNFDKGIIEEIYQLKTDINYLRKSALPLPEMLYKLNHTESPLIQKKTKKFMFDLEDIVKHFYEVVESYSTIISDQLSIYNTFLNNKANDVMKVLTIFASIFIPLTFIAGIYGTNFDYLPELHYKYSYLFFWIVLLILAGSMLYFFKRKKWF